MTTDSVTDERGAMYVTATSQDPRFTQPYIDVREWRDQPARPSSSPLPSHTCALAMVLLGFRIWQAAGEVPSLAPG